MDQANCQNVITIDLEEWFHGLEPDISQWPKFERRSDISVRRLLRLFREYDIKATFFVLGDVAVHFPKLVEDIAEAGHEIGTHGMYHQFIYKQSRREFHFDLRRSIEILQPLAGRPIKSYRAPYFSITKDSLWALETLQDEGIVYDSSIFPVHNPRYGIPGSARLPYQISPGLWEFPVSTLPTFLGNIPIGGGFYFRFWPTAFTKYALHRIAKKHEPMLLYFHPWEFDPDQPHYKASSYFAGLRHYYKLNTTLRKFIKMLGDWRFTALCMGMQNFLDTQKPISRESAKAKSIAPTE